MSRKLFLYERAGEEEKSPFQKCSFLSRDTFSCKGAIIDLSELPHLHFVVEQIEFDDSHLTDYISVFTEVERPSKIRRHFEVNLPLYLYPKLLDEAKDAGIFCIHYLSDGTFKYFNNVQEDNIQEEHMIASILNAEMMDVGVDTEQEVERPSIPWPLQTVQRAHDERTAQRAHDDVDERDTARRTEPSDDRPPQHHLDELLSNSRRRRRETRR